MKARAHSKTAKWYNLICLVLITIGPIITVISAVFGTYDAYGIEIPATEVLRLLAIASTGILGIVGMLQEKSWAKWFAIFAYGLCIFAVIEGMVNSFSLESAFLVGDSNVLIVLRLVRLIVIGVLLAGAALLLKRPRPINTSGDGE